MDAEIQTTIDECSDGTWEGVLYIGSNFTTRVSAATFIEAATQLDREVRRALATRPGGAG